MPREIPVSRAQMPAVTPQVILFLQGAGAIRMPPRRILAVVTAENIVEVGGVPLECKGAIEKLLGNHSEELSLALRPISVNKGFVPLFGEAA